MANKLDEMSNEIFEEGKETNVIAKQLKVEATSFEKSLPYLISFIGLALTIIFLLGHNYIGLVFLLIPIWVYKRMADISSYFSGMEQKIQAAASEIDNYMEQRVIILENAKRLIETSINVDKDIFIDLAKYRSGNFSPEERASVAADLQKATKNLNIVLEQYPELQSQNNIANAMQQNSYLQREITAARTKYNDTVYQWNREIFLFPFKKIVAAKEGLTTRIPFIASKEIKDKARSVMF